MFVWSCWVSAGVVSEILGFGPVAAGLRLQALVFNASSWNSGFPIGVPLRLLFRDPSGVLQGF